MQDIMGLPVIHAHQTAGALQASITNALQTPIQTHSPRCRINAYACQATLEMARLVVQAHALSVLQVFSALEAMEISQFHVQSISHPA